MSVCLCLQISSQSRSSLPLSVRPILYRMYLCFSFSRLPILFSLLTSRRVVEQSESHIAHLRHRRQFVSLKREKSKKVSLSLSLPLSLCLYLSVSITASACLSLSLLYVIYISVFLPTLCCDGDAAMRSLPKTTHVQSQRQREAEIQLCHHS